MENEIQIVDYDLKYKSYFKDLNKEWIDQYFVMEEADEIALNNPEEYVIDKGGNILFALIDGEVVGVCALVKMHNKPYDFELSKMAVKSGQQGMGIGKVLANAIIERAKQRGAKNLYLESNTVLEAAIHLYYKLGFKKIEGLKSPYERTNIHMLLEF